jgi:hypothetical protein
MILKIPKPFSTRIAQQKTIARALTWTEKPSAATDSNISRGVMTLSAAIQVVITSPSTFPNPSHMSETSRRSASRRKASYEARLERG